MTNITKKMPEKNNYVNMPKNMQSSPILPTKYITENSRNEQNFYQGKMVEPQSSPKNVKNNNKNSKKN